MCGILSIISGGAPIETRRVEAGLEAMKHRGPDGSGIWMSEDRRVSLGHVRLSIVDIEGGQQPLTNEDGQVVAAVNGEFYDDERIRQGLERRGHRFRTKSDSEVLVHLYEELGVDCLRELRGEFAFVLWDEAKKKLFAARDRFGVKPLCWTKNGDELVLASEAKALFALGVPAIWDEEAFLHAAHHHYTPPNRTLFDGVCQLRPGHFLVADETSVRTQKYWDISLSGRSGRSEAAEASRDIDEITERLRESLEESVRLRMRADVPVACTLSGGLDSSSIAALASSMIDEPVACFGVSFDSGSYDEREYAEAVAAHVGAEFYPVEVCQSQMLEHLEEAVFHAEGLAINGHLSAKLLLSRAISEAGFKVVLSGEGADEALLGYPHLRRDLWGPSSERNLLETNRASAGVMLPAGDALSTEGIRRRLGFVPTFMKAKAGLGWRVVQMLDEGLLERSGDVDYFDGLLESLELDENFLQGQPVEKSAYLWSRLALANYILRTLGDGTEMAHSVEGRTPFLDRHLFSFCSELPVELKIRDGVEKWILRRAVADLLPKAVVKRQKHPFLAPPLLFDADGHTRVQDILRSRAAKEMPFFDWAKIETLLDGVPEMSESELQMSAPVLMTILTTFYLNRSMKLGIR